MSKGLDQEVFPDFDASRKHSQQRRKDADASPYWDAIRFALNQ